MHPTFAASVYRKTKSTVENRVRSSVDVIQQKYEKQLAALESELSSGSFAYNTRLYDKRKGRILHALHQETSEVEREANRYLLTLGLQDKKEKKQQNKGKSTLNYIGARAWTKSAAGAKMKTILSKSGSNTVRSNDPDGHWNPFLGYIGPPSERTSSTWMDSMAAPIGNSENLESERGQCFKLDKSPKSFDPIQQALLYLKLREDGCSKEKSMVYSVRRRCMTDSTIRKDGPSCHRTIRLGDNRTTGPNWKGWQLHPPMLKVGPKFSPMEESSDQREYEILAQEFERLRVKQERQRQGMDFEEIDKSRDRYFRNLNSEWEKRKLKSVLSRKASTQQPLLLSPPSMPALSTTSTPAMSSLPQTITHTPQPVDPVSPEPPAILTLSLTPTEPTEASTIQSPQPLTLPELALRAFSETPDEDTSTKPSYRDIPPSVWIDPSLVSNFDNGSLVIRNLMPCKTSLAEVEKPKKLDRLLNRTRTRINLQKGDPPNSLPHLGAATYQELVTRMRHQTVKERMSDLTSSSPKSNLMLGIAKMFAQPSISPEPAIQRLREDALKPLKAAGLFGVRERKDESLSLETSRDSREKK